MLDITLQETRVYQDAKAEGKVEGREEGKEEEARRLVLRQLTRRLKQELAQDTITEVTALSLTQLEALGEALLDFEQLQDLQDWLHRSQKSLTSQD